MVIVTAEVDGDDNILVEYEVCVCVLIMRRKMCLDADECCTV